jgi:hypothetical protein
MDDSISMYGRCSPGKRRAESGSGPGKIHPPSHQIRFLAENGISQNSHGVTPAHFLKALRNTHASEKTQQVGDLLHRIVLMRILFSQPFPDFLEQFAENHILGFQVVLQGSESLRWIAK